MILNNHEFRGCFSGNIEQLLIEKNAEGFLYDSAKYILIRFDKFFRDRGITEAVITRELVNDWGTSNGNESRINPCRQPLYIRLLMIPGMAKKRILVSLLTSVGLNSTWMIVLWQS